MNQGLAKVGTNRFGGATIVLQKVNEVQKESEFSMLTSPSFQSIIGATQKRRERLGLTVLLRMLAGAGLVLVMAYDGC